MMHGLVFDINMVCLITQIHKTMRLKTLFGALGPIFEIILIIQKQTKKYNEWNDIVGGHPAFIFQPQSRRLVEIESSYEVDKSV